MLTCLLYKGFCSILKIQVNPALKSSPRILVKIFGMDLSICENASIFRASISSLVNCSYVLKTIPEET